MAHIIRPTREDALVDGLQGCLVCDAAIQLAKRLAAEDEADVILYDDDGVWLVHPDDRHADELDADELARLGYDES